MKPEPTVTKPVPKAPLVTEPAEPVDARPAMSLPPETVVPPEYVFVPDRVNVPGVALTVSRLAPLMLPDSLAAIALNVSDVLPVLV